MGDPGQWSRGVNCSRGKYYIMLLVFTSVLCSVLVLYKID